MQPSDADDRLRRYYREQRLRAIAGVRRLPARPRDAIEAMRRPERWRRLAVDFWTGSVYLLFATGAGAVVLVVIAVLYLTAVLPPRAAWISDMRLAHNYADVRLTSGALAGDSWLAIGTEGAGVEAYRRTSGRLGIWRTFTSASVGGALPSDMVRSIASNGDGVWYVASDGLAWSSPDLDRWEQLIGLTGFAAAPRQRDIIAAVLSADKRLLAISTAQTAGIYDIPHHRWLGEVTPGAPIRAAAFFGERRLFLGTAKGLFAYQIGEQPSQIVTYPSGTLDAVAVRKLDAGPEWLLAVTDGQGLLGHAKDGAWQWLVGEGGFGSAPASLDKITAVSLEGTTLWLGAGTGIGRYSLTDHSWQTTEPDGSNVLALATFAGMQWAGTERGLYHFANGKWVPVPQTGATGAKQLLVVRDRLWVVTADSALGSVGADLAWKPAIDSRGFAEATPSSVTDVAVVGDEYWVASANAGVASYSWARRAWTDRRVGLNSSAVTSLHASGNELWALTGIKNDASAPYTVQRWRGGAWETISDTLGLELTTVGGTTLLLKDDNALLPIEPQARAALFGTVPFNPAAFRAYAYDVTDDRVLVASDDGVLAYERASHSWSRLSQAPAQNVAGGGHAVLYVTKAGGLASNAQLLPDDGTDASFGVPTTATVWRDTIWLSDGKQIALYTPSIHTLAAAPATPPGTIRQLRTVDDTVWALATQDSKNHLYRYIEASRTWEQVSGAASVVRLATVSDAIAFADADGGLTVAHKSRQESYFTGTFAGLADIVRARQGADGQIWLLSPTAGVGRYDPQHGTWTTVVVERPVDIEFAYDNNGAEVALVVGAKGLFAIRPGENSTTLVDQDITALATLNSEVYALGNNPPRIAQWNGSRLDTMQAFDVGGTDLNVDGQVTRVSPPAEIAAGGGRLWAQHGTVVVGYEPQGNKLLAIESYQLPAGTAAARLVEGDTNIVLYYGTPSECWQLQNSTWSLCPTSDLLAQLGKTLTDPFGHSWQVGPFGAKVTAPFNPAGFFGSDRARDVVISAGILLVQTDDDVWIASLSTGWQTRMRGSGPLPSAPTTTSFVPQEDGWTYSLTTDPTALADRLAITWSRAPNVARTIAAGRFADDSASAVAYFGNRFWLGTRAGIFALDGVGMRNRELQIGAPLRPVARMVATDGALYAAFESGEIWQYQPAQGWTPATALPATPSIRDDLGVQLFGETASGITTAPMTKATSPRFVRDQILSIAGTGSTLLLATPDGILHAELAPRGIKVTALGLPVAAPISEIHLRNDGETVFAQVGGAAGTYFRFDGADWQQAQLAATPFAGGTLRPEQITGVPLRWRRARDLRSLEPLLVLNAEQPIAWSSGRLALDVVNATAADGDRLLIATQAGPYAYELLEDGWQLLAAPGPSTAAPATAAGRGAEQFWIAGDSGKHLRLTIDGTTIGGSETSDPAILVRPAVKLGGGQWQWQSAPPQVPLLTLEGLGTGKRPFTNDGRFVFDRVSDAASGRDGIWLATDAGIVVYERAPLMKQTHWDQPGGQSAARVTIENAQVFALASGQAYRHVDGSWQPDAAAQPMLLPLGVRFDGGGWRSEHLERGALVVTGLENRESLFAGNGKFVFDNLQGVVATPRGILLLTEAGWVAARHEPSTAGFASFEVFGETALPPGLKIDRVEWNQHGGLIAETNGPGRVRLTWPLQGDRPGPVSTVSTGPVDLSLPDYRIVDRTAGQIALIHDTQALTLASAASWYWPFDMPLWHRPIPRVVSFVDDGPSVWVIGEHGLVHVDKGRLGVR
jgi:frataxin-like iron-binding protein CyaY